DTGPGFPSWFDFHPARCRSANTPETTPPYGQHGNRDRACNCENTPGRIFRFRAARAETMGKSQNFGIFVTCRAVPLRERCEPCAEQFDAGAAIHCPLERLQPIDLTLDRPVAPAFRQRVPHRRKAVAYGSRKALYRLQATPGRLVQPLIELVEIATPHDPSKAHSEPSHGAEARGRLLQRHNLCRLRLGQHAFRFHTKGGCHDWGDLPSGCRVDRRTPFAEWLWAG